MQSLVNGLDHGTLWYTYAVMQGRVRQRDALKCIEMRLGGYISLIDWISDTRSHGYTDLQGLVKCLDHRDIVSDTACSQAKVVLGCAMH